jgi:hypothetical protein
MSSSDQRNLITTSALVILGCIIAWYVMIDRRSAQPPPKQVMLKPVGELRIKKEAPPHQVVAKEEAPGRPLLPPTVFIPPKATVAQIAAEVIKPPVEQPDFVPDEVVELPPPQPVIPLEVARFALGFVGSDPQANEVWNEAINDPNMSPRARQDLIEDLNQEGFADPRNITQDDLPLILNRIALIEELGPDAMDETNAQAFAEAYKDLVNMAIRLQPPPDAYLPN